MEQMKKNLNIIFCALAVVLAALVIRVFWIQVACGEELKEAAFRQSLVLLEGVDTRGMICDRNGSPLLGNQTQYLYVIPREKRTVQVSKLLASLHARQIGGDNRQYYVYASGQYRKDIGSRLMQQYQAYILKTAARYGDDQIAAGLIGYINRRDHTGAAGLELMCDRQLSQSVCHMYAAADVQGRLIPGRGLLDDSTGGASRRGTASVKTTLNKPLQEEVEKILQDYPQDCVAIVLDRYTGDVLSMAYTPSFDPNNVEQYLKRDSDVLRNKATQGEYAPGSVFKIIVAASALEQGVSADQRFFCSGSVCLGDISIGCKTGGSSGHGWISMEEAFAQSCNSYFVQLGQMTGADAIRNTAKAMGLGAKPLTGYPQQSSGHIMTLQESSGAGIGNLSIGQGQTLATPLQIARMTGIVASDGIDHGTHILLSEKTQAKRVLQKNTAQELQRMMRMVTEHGTACRLGLEDSGGKVLAAVKTGTAQYGLREENKSYGWLTGFTPCENPEYIVTVFAGGTSTSAADAGPVYRRILYYLSSQESCS